MVEGEQLYKEQYNGRRILLIWKR